MDNSKFEKSLDILEKIKQEYKVNASKFVNDIFCIEIEIKKNDFFAFKYKAETVSHYWSEKEPDIIVIIIQIKF